MKNRKRKINANDRLIFAFISAIALTSCTSTLPGAEADAFKKIAAIDKEAFTQLSEAQLTAQTQYAKRAILAGKGRVIVDTGCATADDGPCIVSYTISGADQVNLVEPAVKAKSVLGSLSRYGDAMAELAAAQDLETVNSKAESAGGAVKSFVLNVIPQAAILGPIVDLAVLAAKASLVEKRRKALLANARAADPAIRATAVLLNGTLKPMKTDILLNASREVGDLQERMAKSQLQENAIMKHRKLSTADQNMLAALRGKRASDLDLLVAAAAKVNAMRAINLDFGSLVSAHSELIKKLESPQYSAEEALSNLNQVLVLIDQIKAITQKD